VEPPRQYRRLELCGGKPRGQKMIHAAALSTLFLLAMTILVTAYSFIPS